MSGLDQLNDRDLLGLLARVRKRDALMLPVVVAGTAADLPPEGRVLELDGHQWTALPVRGELGLRRALQRALHDTALLLLIDEELVLPNDLAPRVALHRVHLVDQRTRLLDLFAARDAEPGLIGSALGRALVSDPPPGLRPSGAARLTVEEAWRAGAQGWLRLRPSGADGGGAPGLCRAGLAGPELGPAFSRRHPELRAGLLAHWDRSRGGAVARAIGQAWLNGELVALLGLIIVWDGARRAGPGAEAAMRVLPTYLLRADDDRPAEQRLSTALRDEAVVSGLIGVLYDIFDRTDPPLAPEIERSLVRAAGELPGLTEAQQASPYLPAALAQRYARLGGALERVAAGEEARAGAHDAAHEAIEALKGAEAHRRAAVDAAAAGTLAVARAATRLGLWLHGARGAAGERSAEAYAAWYVAEGAWVDRCRAALRERLGEGGPLALGARAVLRAADAERRRADQRFADLLLDGGALDSPGEGALALCQVLPRLVVPLLREAPDRRLLVLLMDGMSVPVALSVIEGLAMHQLSGRRAPGDSGGLGRALRPAFAALPTLTATSRASFFASKLVARHGDEPERLDARRFAENPHLQGFTASGPQLFLGQRVGVGGALSAELSAAIADPKERVLGAVINVVDDQLDGAIQLSLDWSQTQQVPLLGALLERCEAHDVVVLMVSDHGHVVATERLSSEAAVGGKRWRAVDAATATAARAGEAGALRPEERLLPEACWRPEGAGGLVALWPEPLGYNGVGGAHGGLSLAEVVTPVALLVGARHAERDPSWAPTSVEPPAWWALRRPVLRAPVAPAAGPGPQASLLFVAPPPTKVRVAPVDAAEHPLALALRESERFKVERRDHPPEVAALALRIVDRLAREPGGQEPFGALVEALGLPPAARRAESQVRAAGGLLCAGGPPVLELDRPGDRLRLDRRTLVAEYGLPLELSHDPA